MEEWKSIEGFEGLYEVSNHGRVRRVGGKVLKATDNGRGYFRIPLKNSYRIRKNFSVHRLVAKAFIPNPDNKPQINHIDSNKQNNHISNLEWCTHSENQIHAFKFGFQSNKGEKHPRVKLNEMDVLKIRELLNDGLTLKVIAEMFGVYHTTIHKIKTSKNWTHI